MTTTLRASTMTQANFLILMVDQMTGCMLDEPMLKQLHAPNIKRLLEQGVKFENAYCASPLCTPARGSFMTGQLPSRSGIYDNAAEFPASTPTFAHYLRLQGYQTALSGKMHFVGPDQLHGFEERLTTDIYPADFGWTPNWHDPLTRIDWWYHNLHSVTEAGTAEISNQLEFDDEVAYFARLKLHQYARRLDTHPFCLTVSFTHPHDPYVARQKYWDLYENIDIPLPMVAAIPYAQQDPHSQRLYDAVNYTHYQITAEHIYRARRAYFANISYLDDKIGELLQVLEDCDFAENTVILFCADHGDMLGERGLWYKMCFYEYAMRIPLVLYAPQRFSPRNVATPVGAQDILPTLMELAGADPHQVACPIDGSSLVDLAQGQEQTDRVVYAEYCAEGSVAPMVMIRQGVFKFNYCQADPLQLFDLSTDPNELKNLAPDPAYASVVQQFQQQLTQGWNLEQFKQAVIHSQDCRRLVDAANRKGQFKSWDFQPQQDATQRYMRNHLDLNVLEANNRYPKPSGH